LLLPPDEPLPVDEPDEDDDAVVVELTALLQDAAKK